MQTVLSWHSTSAPRVMRVQVGPVAVVQQWPFFVGAQLQWDAQTFLSVRAGARWDEYWAFADGSGRTGGYICPEAILKRTAWPVV